MESTKTFVEHPSGKLAVTVHAPRSLREEEAAYFHGINLEQAHKFAHLNGWQLTVDREKDDTVSAADADSFKIGDDTIDGVGGKGQQAVRIEAKVGVSDGHKAQSALGNRVYFFWALLFCCWSVRIVLLRHYRACFYCFRCGQLITL